MRFYVFGLACILVAAGISDASAQQRKKSNERQSEGSSSSSSNTSGYQRCENTLFFIVDGGMGPLCRRSDGKVCQVRGGTSGQAILTDCK